MPPRTQGRHKSARSRSAAPDGRSATSGRILPSVPPGATLAGAVCGLVLDYGARAIWLVFCRQVASQRASVQAIDEDGK